LDVLFANHANHSSNSACIATLVFVCFDDSPTDAAAIPGQRGITFTSAPPFGQNGQIRGNIYGVSAQDVSLYV
jgi:hypothetical protein